MDEPPHHLASQLASTLAELPHAASHSNHHPPPPPAAAAAALGFHLGSFAAVSGAAAAASSQVVLGSGSPAHRYELRAPLPSARAAAEAAAAAAVARRVRSRPLAAGSAFALDSAVVDCLVALLAAAMSGGAAARDRCGASDAQLFLVAWRLLGAAPAAHRIPAPPPFAGAAAGAEAVGHALDAARISVASLEASATSAASSAASSALAASVGWMRAAATGLGPRRCRDAASHADGGGGGGGCRGGARHRFVRRPG